MEDFLAGGTPSVALLLTGGPRIGKTTLWERGLRLAAEQGFRVLVARPSGAEAELLTLSAPCTILPGSLGGLLSNPALSGNSVYVATVDLPFKLARMSDPLGAPDGDGTGEIAALNLTTGKVEWDTKVPAMPLGAATVSNDPVFTTLYPVSWSPSTATPARSSTSTSCPPRPTRPSRSPATPSSFPRAVLTSAGRKVVHRS